MAPSLLDSSCDNGSGATTACVSTGSAGVRGADGWTVHVMITAKVPSLIPGVQITVTETSTGPVEQFIPDR